MSDRRRPRRLSFFSGADCLEGIKNNRITDNDRTSRWDSKFDCYSKLNIVYGKEYDPRGINRQVRRKVNRYRSTIDKDRSLVYG